MKLHVHYSLNMSKLLQGGFYPLYGDYDRGVIKGDARSLDDDSHRSRSLNGALPQGLLPFSPLALGVQLTPPYANKTLQA